MGSKVPTPPPEKQNGHARLPVPPPPPPRRGNTTSSNIAKAELAISMLSAIKPGSKCFIGPKMGIEATVVELSYKQGPQYRVTWWDGNNRKSEWMEECELHFPTEKIEVRLGFRD